ncbi:MAG: DUF2934 domain-containing protein [Nitrospirota bacterium]
MEKSKEMYDEICKIAYDLYVKRGRVHGYHLQDWLEAEKIVMARHAAEVEKEARAIEDTRKKESVKKTKSATAKAQERKTKTAERAESSKKTAEPRKRGK